MAALGGEGRGSSPEQGAGEERGAPAARGRRQRWEGGCTRSCVKRRLGSGRERSGERGCTAPAGSARRRSPRRRRRSSSAAEAEGSAHQSHPGQQSLAGGWTFLPGGGTQTATPCGNPNFLLPLGESCGRRLLPARPGPARQSVGPRGAARAPPCSRSPQLQRRGPGSDVRASSPELKAKFGRGAGRAASVRPRRPQCAQPRRGRR